MTADNSDFQKIEIKGRDVLKVELIPKVKLPNFQAIGRINCMHNKKAKTDIFNLLRKASKPAFMLFDDLKDNRNPVDNITYIPTKGLTKSESVMFHKRIKELKQLSIIKKAKTIDQRNPIKKGSYMINPNLIMCPANQQAAEAMWELLK